MPQAQSDYRTSELPPEFGTGKYDWIGPDELVVEVRNGKPEKFKSHDLYLWLLGSRSAKIFSGTGKWCAGGGNLMYETAKKRSSGKVIDLVYQFRPVGKTKGKSIELHSSFETANKTIPLDKWSTGSWLNLQKQSPFDCRWQTNFPLN